MLKLRFAVFVLAALAIPALADDSPFAGTWKFNPSKSHLTGSTMTYTKTATGYRASNGSGLDFEFTLDGKDCPTPDGTTVSWTQTGDRSWDSVWKLNGKPITKVHRELSADGKTLSMTYTDLLPGGGTRDSAATYERVSGGPGLAGTWKDIKVKPAVDSMVISVPGPGQFKFYFPSDQTTAEGPADGTPVAVKGPTQPDGYQLSLKMSSPDKMEYSVLFQGKPVVQATNTLSGDGKILTSVSWTPGKESEKTTSIYEKE